MAFTLGSNAQLGIGIAIELQDRFSGKASAINNQIRAMRKESNSLAMGAVRDYRNQSAQIATGAAAITYGLYNAAKASSEFQHKINQVYIVGGKQLGQSRKQLEDFSRGLSHQFAMTPTEIAGALFENTKAGVTKGIGEITKYQIAVAKATDEQLEGSQGIASNLLGIANAYDVNIKKQGEFAKVANAVTTAANASMASVKDLAESMTYAGFTAHQFGMSYEQTLALLGTLSQAGIRGTGAGTAINNMVQYLGASSSRFATPKQVKMLKALGIDQTQLRGLMDKGDIFGASQLMFQASRGLGPSDRTKMLQTLTNMRGLRGLEGSWLAGDNSKTPQALLQQIYQGQKGDISMAQAKDMQKDLYTQIKFFENSIKEIGISFVKAVTPFLTVALPILTKTFRVFGKILESPIGEFFSTIVAVGAPLVALLFGWRTMVLTSTIALKGFTDTLRVGGYKNIVGAGLNEAGTGFWKFGTSKLPAGVKIAKNGRLYAAEAFEHEGVSYKRGFLPNSFAEGIGYKGSARVGIGKSIGKGIGSLFAGEAAAGGVGIVAGWLGKVAPMLATGLGVIGELLPIVGAIFGIYTIVQAIFGQGEKKKEEPTDQQAAAIRKEYMGRLYGNLNDSGWQNYKMAYSNSNQGKQPFQITINTNVDGRQMQSKQINDVIDDSVAKEFESNLYAH